MTKRIAIVFACGATLATVGLHAQFPGSDVALRAGSNPDLISTIAFSSTRDDPANPGFAEIYLVNGDGTDPRRLTENTITDAFANLSPDGKKIVFDSNRNRVASEPANTSDLFVMNTDGTEQTFLIRGSTATWSPDSKNITFHASASGTGAPINDDPGAATTDSDIFVMNVDDRLAGGAAPANITNNPAMIDDNPDWSPDGQTVVFTSHLVSDHPVNSVTAEIYVINASGSGGPVQLTSNAEEERAPAWSPDGTRIVFMCRRGPLGGQMGFQTFEICVMNADGSSQTQLTSNSVGDLSPSWSPDGRKIVFHRPGPGGSELWVMNLDGTAQTQLTNTPGINLLANWGVLRVKVKGS
jgi:Tol biopolymer transport system component